MHGEVKVATLFNKQALSAGRYSLAISKLDEFKEKYKSTKTEVIYLTISKPLLYKTYGNAFAGLKNFDKAKDQYKIALLYYKDFEPAQKALHSLDQVYLKQKASDKLPPVISILKPFDSQKEIMVSGKSIVIKGMAMDAS